MVVMVRLLSRIEVVIVNNNLRFRDLIGKTSLHKCENNLIKAPKKERAVLGGGRARSLH